MFRSPTSLPYYQQDFAYSYRVWITMIKRIYALLPHLKIDPDIYLPE